MVDIIVCDDICIGDVVVVYFGLVDLCLFVWLNGMLVIGMEIIC